MESDVRERIETDAEMRALGARLVSSARPGDLLLLKGVLGAGKTTLVRGALRALGWEGAVRSPSFGLMQPYETIPPVLHADLYRVETAAGLGLEDFLDSHVCFIEWADRDEALWKSENATQIAIEVLGDARLVTIRRPVR